MLLKLLRAIKWFLNDVNSQIEEKNLYWKYNKNF